MKLYSTIVSAMVLGATAINSITGGVNTAFDAGNNLYNIVETSEKSVDEMGKASSYGINIEPQTMILQNFPIRSKVGIL